MRTFLTALLSIGLVVGFQARALLQGPSKVSASLLAEAADGPVRVIVRLNVPLAAVGAADDAVAAQRAAIVAAQDVALLALPGLAEDVVRLTYSPMFVVTTDQAGLARLSELSSVIGVEKDRFLYTTRETERLTTTTDIIQADVLWSQGTEGAGWSVALLDTGVETSHVFLGGRIAAEACFSSNVPSLNISSLCPSGDNQQIGPGAGVNCGSGVPTCDHGTYLAGVIMGRLQTLSGVARAASLIPIQVMSRNTTSPGAVPLAAISDVVRALDHVRSLAATGAARIAAVHVGPEIGADFSGSCDDVAPSLTTAIDQLRAIGIPTVFASGDQSLQNRILFPLCISRAITVASSTGNSTGTFVSTTSNRGPGVDLAAPGENVRSSAFFNSFQVRSGSAGAAAHVAGSWALLKSRLPVASVDTVLTALQRTGEPAIDPFFTARTFPRITLDRAAGSLGPAGSPTSVLANVSGTTLSSTWNAPFDGSVPIGYHVELTSTITGQAAIVNVGQNNVFITTLPNGTYTLRVRSVTAAGPTAASVDVPFVIGPVTRADAPLPPSGLRADVENRRVSLSWNLDSNSNFVTSYVIEAGSSPGSANFGVFEIPNNGTNLTVDNVQPGTYYVRIRARNQYGTSTASNEVVFTVTASGCVIPLPPSPLNATVVGSLVTLNWRPPAVEGTVIGYVVEVGSAPGLTNIARLQTGTATILSASGPSGIYFVRVRALSACGQTGPTNEVVVVIP